MILLNGGYSWYEEDERYASATRGEGGVSLEWMFMYDLMCEEYLKDKVEVVVKGILFGSFIDVKVVVMRKSSKTLCLFVTSMLYVDCEYGGLFWIDVLDIMCVNEVKKFIVDKIGVMLGFVCLVYVGKKFDDNSRTFA